MWLMRKIIVLIEVNCNSHRRITVYVEVKYTGFDYAKSCVKGRDYICVLG